MLCNINVIHPLRSAFDCCGKASNGDKRRREQRRQRSTENRTKSSRKEKSIITFNSLDAFSLFCYLIRRDEIAHSVYVCAERLCLYTTQHQLGASLEAITTIALAHFQSNGKHSSAHFWQRLTVGVINEWLSFRWILIEFNKPLVTVSFLGDTVTHSIHQPGNGLIFDIFRQTFDVYSLPLTIGLRFVKRTSWALVANVRQGKRLEIDAQREYLHKLSFICS